MPKCFILCRQSSGQEADESLSLAVQADECMKTAASHGLTIAKIFKEANTSGRLYPSGFESIAAQDIIYMKWCRETKKTGIWREELGRLLERLDEIDFIVVYDLTRFFRPLNGSFLGSLLMQKLQGSGVRLLSLKEGIIDFQRFQDFLISTLTSQINSEQLRTQVEKSKAAYRRLKDAGEYYASLSRLHGYKKTGVKLEVAIDDRAAEMVRSVFKRYIEAVPINVIIRDVSSKYPDIFKKPCRRCVIMKMLRCPAYCGYQRNSAGDLVKSKQLAGKELISLEQWMKAQEKLDSNKIHIKRPKRSWTPLTGLIYCGECGGKMKLVKGRKQGKAYYVCMDHIRSGKPPCRNNIMHTDEVVQNGLIEAVQPLLTAEAMKLMNASEDMDAERRAIAEKELMISEVRRKRSKLTEMWLSSLLDEATYESSVLELKTKESALEREIVTMRLKIERDTSAFDWVKLMMKFKGDALSKGEYEQLVNGMVKKIVVHVEDVEIYTAYGMVTLPRERLNRRNVIWRHILKMENRKAAVIYYKGRYADGEAEKIGILGDLEVFLAKNSDCRKKIQ